MNSEKGQALPLVLLALAIGTLVITPFLGHANSSLIGSRVYGQTIEWQYARDAGVEHAIWSLTYGDLASQLPSPGDNTTYQLSEAVNGVAPTVTVTANATDSIGQIMDAVIDTLEFDTDTGATPHIVPVSGNVYAIAYQGQGNDGFLKTMEIAASGQITDAVIDTLEFDTNTGA
ncbi:MAG: hypothetical protein KKF26_01755, partial [Chloroflexi bacterium]|nr:hypothetical protein [Chloroflexota bacterium]